MPRQFVSICGHSAAGKKTLIRKLLANDPPGLRERFGVTEPVGAYGYCEAMGKPDGMLHAKEQTVLHFWQDNSRDWVAHLKEVFPGDVHRVILLWRPYESHSQALLDRNTPGYRPSPKDVRDNWNGMRVPQFRALEAKGFAIELIHGETYETLSAWPS